MVLSRSLRALAGLCANEIATMPRSSLTAEHQSTAIRLFPSNGSFFEPHKNQKIRESGHLSISEQSDVILFAFICARLEGPSSQTMKGKPLSGRIEMSPSA